MPVRHTVVAGETLAVLAERHGFARGADLYEHPDNASLRERRENPDVLAPGDEVVIPDPAVGLAEVRVDARHRFRVQRPRQQLRLAPRGCDGQPLDGWQYVLTAGAERFEGTVDGPIVHPVAFGVEEARLELHPDDDTQTPLRWDLRVGHLDPAETVEGQQARLNNLGFSCGPADGDAGPRTQRGIRDFQAAHGLDVDGNCTEAVRDRLREVYGC
ncbi:MAG: peptidoglycan-binding protein [Nannocystales bacterium]